MNIINQVTDLIENCDLFVSVGTSGVVWPAAGFPQKAKSTGAYCIEMNPEITELSYLFNEVINCKASEIGKYFKI
jgi:NAD-dependent deacetylase